MSFIRSWELGSSNLGKTSHRLQAPKHHRCETFETISQLADLDELSHTSKQLQNKNYGVSAR